MDQKPPRTEIILSHSRATLSSQYSDQYLNWNPQPGGYLEVEGQTYQVVERKHRYLFKAGHYHLHQIVLHVQKSQVPTERSCIDGCWVIGDITCAFNARSEMLRCTVNPSGPCQNCRHYQPLEKPNDP
jgi:hypothetical protein